MAQYGYIYRWRRLKRREFMGLLATSPEPMETHTCRDCGIVYAAPQSFWRERRRTHQNFSCPNGHERHFVSESDEERLRKELERANSRVDFYRRESEQQKRSRSAMKGQLTKTRNRIAKGVCPCCNRTFEDLARHMTSKHPNYAETE